MWPAALSSAAAASGSVIDVRPWISTSLTATSDESRSQKK